MKKAVICLLLTITLLWLNATIYVSALPTSGEPTVSAESAVLIDASDGTVLYEKNASVRKGMASTTKIMTALIVAEALELDTPKEIPKEAIGVEGSSVYLTEGESLTARQLLYALMLSSANDAATALAIITAGSIDAFAEKMNEKASVLGLKDTHFVNPHGLYDEEHYTTAYELALISAEAIKCPTVRDIASTYKTTIPMGDNERGRVLVNHNKLLKLYDGAIGLKTGFTKKTGRCLVSAAERDGLTLIAVTLNAPDDWNDHVKMLDFGFGNYESVTLYDTGNFRYYLPIVGGTEGYVVLSNTVPVILTLPKGQKRIVQKVFLSQRFEFAPVEAGKPCGRIVFISNEKSVESPLVTLYSVSKAKEQKRGFLAHIFSFFADLFT